MRAEFVCPACSEPVQVPIEFAGTRAECPRYAQVHFNEAVEGPLTLKLQAARVGPLAALGDGEARVET